jgi:hypothetical protein
VLCTAGGVGAFFLLKDTVSEVQPIMTITSSFVGDVQSGDSASAYDKLCEPTRERFTAEKFAAVVKGQPKISKHRIVGAHVRTTNGGKHAIVIAELANDDTGAAQRHEFRLVPEAGTWKVCGSPY